MSDTSTQPPNRILTIIARIEDGLLVFLLSTMIFLAGMQIILRNVFSTGFTETDSLLKILVLWVGMLGAVVATRERRHISIDILSRYLSEKMRQYVEVVVDIFVVLVCILLATHSMRMLLVDFEAKTIAFSGVPTWLLESILPIAFTIISLRYLMYCWQGIGKLLKGDSST
ncbi:MAG: TRAP transporter small permease [Gammaproteobacteria bacterium]|nr:TRAP transporter small permease [Gammaproteobacteria bacterium]